MPFDKNKLIAYLLYTAPFFFIINPWTRFALFVLGVLLGLVLLILDEVYFYQHYNEKEELEAAQQAQQPPFLVTRSTLFLIALVPLGLFVVTSTGSALGGGLMMGIILGLMLELWEYRRLPQAFKQRFLSQLDAEISGGDINWVVYGATAFFLFLNLLVIV